MPRLQARAVCPVARTAARVKVAAASFLCIASLASFPAFANFEERNDILVFGFQLEDVSAGASSGKISPEDAAQLANVTNQVIELLWQSGRIIPAYGWRAQDAVGETNALHACDAAAGNAAFELSLVGVVRRISHTVYTVRFEVCDLRTREIIAAGESGLHVGAAYSWSRGAVRLVKDQLLEGPAQQ
jgi:hypothetical protein